LPLVLPLPIWSAILILSIIAVSVCKEIRSISVSQTAFPLAFESISISPYMDPITLGFIVSPLSYIAVSLDSLPDSLSFLHSFRELPIIDFSILPSINPFPICLAHMVLAMISIARREDLESSSMSFVILPFALVDSAIIIRLNSSSIPHESGRVNLSSVNGVSVHFDSEPSALLQLLVCELVRQHLVLLH
jgi:hypothetical protein